MRAVQHINILADDVFVLIFISTNEKKNINMDI